MTKGQVERMTRTINDATAKRCHDNTHAQLEPHLTLFIDAYNTARRLKTLGGEVVLGGRQTIGGRRRALRHVTF